MCAPLGHDSAIPECRCGVGPARWRSRSRIWLVLRGHLSVSRRITLSGPHVPVNSRCQQKLWGAEIAAWWCSGKLLHFLAGAWDRKGEIVPSWSGDSRALPVLHATQRRVPVGFLAAACRLAGDVALWQQVTLPGLGLCPVVVTGCAVLRPITGARPLPLRAGSAGCVIRGTCLPGPAEPGQHLRSSKMPLFGDILEDIQETS